MVLAIRAPWRGGFEYIGRITIFSWLSTRARSSGSAVVSENAPTRSPYKPMFFANDCESAIWWPSLTKWRTAKASRVVEPDANPWYAMSKNGKSFFSLTISEISFHCSGVGSTPVGLCAHACKRMMLPSGAF